MSEAADLPVRLDTDTRTWVADWPVDLARTLGPIRRGTGDPAYQLAADGTSWWATRTPHGVGTLALRAIRGSGTAQVTARAWGDGAGWLLDRLPRLIGADDDWRSLDVSAYPGLVDCAHRHPGVRLPATGRLFEAVVAAVLEQRVTGREARRSWRELLHRFGTPAPGPIAGRAPNLFVPPDPATVLDITTWDWHRMGVEAARQRPIRAAATVAARLERCDQSTVLAVLLALPGIGVWTAAESAQRAFGHPDAVSVGDYHLHDVVVHALTGRARGGDEEMLALLAPWTGQRQRVVRLIELSGIGKPRFGPRYSPLDIRAL